MTVIGKRVSPLFLVDLLRDAFMAGAGVKELERIPEDVQQRWMNYEPSNARFDELNELVTNHNRNEFHRRHGD